MLEITSQWSVLILRRRGYDQHSSVLDRTRRIVLGDRHELVYRYAPTK